MKLAILRAGVGAAAVLGLVGSLSEANEPAYVGAAKCKMCHIQQYKSWETTNMARSFDVLRAGERAEAKQAAGLDAAADYTRDDRCLPCHTTGYGEPGGFVDIETTPHLAGVQCEACHGPGSEYLEPDKMSLKNKEYSRAELVAAGLVVPVADTCTSTCHNEKSPFADAGDAFDFEQRKHDGTHEHIALKYPH